MPDENPASISDFDYYSSSSGITAILSYSAQAQGGLGITSEMLEPKWFRCLQVFGQS
jgi:hypothetical protein